MTDDPLPLLTDGVLTARRADETDITTICELESGSEVSEFILADSPEVHCRALGTQGIFYLMLEVTSGETIGFALLVTQDDGVSVEFRRLVIARTHRGKGLGQHAVNLVGRYCGERLRRSRVWLDVFTDNHRARHVYERCGYRLTGETPQGSRRLSVYETTIPVQTESA